MALPSSVQESLWIRLGLIGIGLGALLVNALVLSVDSGIGYGAFLLLICSVVLLVLSRQRTGLVPHERWLIATLAVFPAVVALMMGLHGEWHWSHFDKPSRFLLVIPIFLAIRHWGLSRSWLFIGIVVGAIAAGSFGYYQKYIQGLSVAQGYTHKIPFGDISLMLGLLSLAAFIPSKAWRAPRWLLALALVGFGFGLLGSICSGTRGGWIAIPLLLWLVLSAAIGSRKIRCGIYGACLVGLVLIYQNNALVKYKVDRAVVTTQSYFTEGKIAGSAGTRLEMWRGAWLQFSDNPWLGVGKENYRPESVRLKEEGRFRGPIYDHPHNDLFNLLAELGLLGGLSLVWLYGGLVLFFARWRGVDPQLATMGLLLSFGYIDFSLTQAMLEHNISTSFLAINGAVLAGMLSHRYQQSRNPTGVEHDPLPG